MAFLPFYVKAERVKVKLCNDPGRFGGYEFHSLLPLDLIQWAIELTDRSGDSSKEPKVKTVI